MSNELTDAIIKHYGEKSQMLKLIEEMAELTVELSKVLNSINPIENEKLMEEIVDVEIVFEQVKKIVTKKNVFSDHSYWSMRSKKLNRVADRIGFKI